MERQDVLDRLIDLLPAVVDTFPVYSKLPNTRTRGAADDSSLLHSIFNSEFIVCLITVRECLSLMQSLTRSLQERKMNVECVLANVSVVKNSLQVFRNEVANVVYGFKEAISLPFLDHLLQEMETRLTDLHKYATLGFIMVPSGSQIKEYQRFVFLLLR